ncbi:hypothetical protein GCM10009806_07470 [Microbacterium flavum]
MQVWHMAMHASSIAIIDAGVMPCIRIMARIIVLHMSAQFIQETEQSIICVEQTVHACSQAAQASMHACIIVMSRAGMPSIDIMSSVMAFIIIASIGAPLTVSVRASRTRARLLGPRYRCPAAGDRLT